MFPYRATIRCRDESGMLCAALKPEEATTERMSVLLRRSGRDCSLMITAADATALKAVMSSATRLLEMAEKVQHDQ